MFHEDRNNVCVSDEKLRFETWYRSTAGVLAGFMQPHESVSQAPFTQVCRKHFVDMKLRAAPLGSGEGLAAEPLTVSKLPQ